MSRLFDSGLVARCRSEVRRHVVLLVEPDEVLRGALQCILAWENYTVLTATNRAEFRLRLQGGSPQVVLVDGTTADLRRDLASVRVPVVVFYRNSAEGPVLSNRALEELLACVRR